MKIILMLLMTLAVNVVYAQSSTGTIYGRIVDSDGQALYPVAIAVEGTSVGTQNNADGTFVLSGVKPGEVILRFFILGSQPKQLNVSMSASGKVDVGDVLLEADQTEIDEVMVVSKSAARIEQEKAFAVSVVDLSKMYNVSAPISKLLGAESSVRIREDGGMGSSFSMSINGFSGNQVKFFMDGIPMDNFGASFSIANFSSNMAERIDVYKGVIPVALGADALGGAVNVVTRHNANYLDASYSVGSFNTHKVALNGALTSDRGLTVRLNGFYNYSDNDYKVYAQVIDLKTNAKMGNKWVRRFHDDYSSKGMRLEIGFTGRSWCDYLLLGLIMSENNNNVQTGATMDAVYGGVETSSKSLIPSIRFKKDDILVDGLSLSVYGTYAAVDNYSVDTLAYKYNWLGERIATNNRGEFALNDTKIMSREWQGIANLSYVINEHQNLTLNNVASTIERVSHDYANPNNVMNDIEQNLSKNVTGLGYQVKFSKWNANFFGKFFNLKTSTYKQFDAYTDNERWEKVNASKQNLGYGAALTYFIIDDMQLKASYELACRMPEAVEMFGDGLLQKSNINLKPEKSKNLNIGLGYCHLASRHKISADVNVIYRNADDFIRKGVSLSSNPTTGYENLGNVVTKGVESSARYELASAWHVGGNVTYQKITDEEKWVKISNSYVGSTTENITYGQKLPNIPYLFATAETGWAFTDVVAKASQLTVDYSMSYVHEYFLSFTGLGSASAKKVIPTQVSHNVAVGYSMQNGRYSVNAEVCNLTNEKLYDNYKLQKPTRSFSIKLRYFIYR
ncbi:MAG: TonB-dependent receptor [Bacteroidales bacterium]|nr:TonB-dependent receptor [Bacteroidales bacterium]